MVHAVIFSDGVSVSDSNFISHSRKEIKVPVPIKARTGKIIVSNEAEGIPNWIYSESRLTVNLPTFTSLSSTSVKPGSTLTINGENLGWIKSISFAGVETTKFTVSEEKKSITVTVPTNAPKGDVTMTTYSGITVAAGSITTINPNNLTVSPNPVKNGIVKVQFNNMEAATYQLRIINNIGQTIITKSIKHAGGSSSQSIQDERLLAGTYILQLSNGASVINQKLIVE